MNAVAAEAVKKPARRRRRHFPTLRIGEGSPTAFFCALSIVLTPPGNAMAPPPQTMLKVLSANHRKIHKSNFFAILYPGCLDQAVAGLTAKGVDSTLAWVLPRGKELSSPLAPVLRGEGSGVRGWNPSWIEQLVRETSAPHPQALSRSTGRGERNETRPNRRAGHEGGHCR